MQVRSDAEQHLGFLGPAVRAEVGDTVKCAPALQLYICVCTLSATPHLPLQQTAATAVGLSPCCSRLVLPAQRTAGSFNGSYGSNGVPLRV